MQNLIDRLENWIANYVAKRMVQNAKATTRKASISAVVKRADGRIEDLGVISETEVSLLKFNWFGLKNLFNKK